VSFTAFIEFMLSAIRTSLIEATGVIDEMSDVTKGRLFGRWQQIEQFMYSHDYIRNADVRKLCGISAATANRILAGFVAEGRLVRYREGRHWAYRLADEQQNS